MTMGHIAQNKPLSKYMTPTTILYWDKSRPLGAETKNKYTFSVYERLSVKVFSPTTQHNNNYKSLKTSTVVYPKRSPFNMSKEQLK